MSQLQRAEGGKVLAFAAPPLRSRRPTPVAKGQGGTVLLFTGVRYERMVESIVVPPAVVEGGPSAVEA